MTSIRWLALVVALLFVPGANAQFPKAQLSEGAHDVVEATPGAVASCEVVYRWDRCHGGAGKPTTSPDRGEQRRLNCITSSRNVAARKGASHYVLQGAVFTGYRCTTSVTAVAAPESPSLPVRRQMPAAAARYKALGFVPWGGACTRIDELFDDVCDAPGMVSGRVGCRQARAAALSGGERVYYQPSVDHQVTYDAKARAYTVQFKGVLGRLGAPDGQRYLIAGPLVVPRRGTTSEAIADAARAFEQLVVPEGALQAPSRFARDLLIEALVRPKAVHAPARRNPAQISALEVEVVGLRAYVPDLSWGVVVVPAPDGIPSYQCAPLDPSRGP